MGRVCRALYSKVRFLLIGWQKKLCLKTKNIKKYSLVLNAAQNFNTNVKTNFNANLRAIITKFLMQDLL